MDQPHPNAALTCGSTIELRDQRQINDQTLRAIERELDLEELRMEG